MFINPFENRSFSARFAAVFSFAKQNFFSVLKFYFPVFLLLSGILYLLITLNPQSNSVAMASGVMFVGCAYMDLYIKHNGAVGPLSFKEYYNALGRSFLISIEVCIWAFLFFLPLALLLCLILVFVKLPVVVFTVLFLSLYLVLFLLSQLFHIHYYFSYKEYKRPFPLLKEVFCMLKGHWLSSLLYFLIFDVLSIVVILPFSTVDVCMGNNIFTYFLTPLLAFFIQSNALVFQYGHLSTLWKNKQPVDSIED